jgi:hypothetical protein
MLPLLELLPRRRTLWHLQLARFGAEELQEQEKEEAYRDCREDADRLWQCHGEVAGVESTRDEAPGASTRSFLTMQRPTSPVDNGFTAGRSRDQELGRQSLVPKGEGAGQTRSGTRNIHVIANASASMDVSAATSTAFGKGGL